MTEATARLQVRLDPELYERVATMVEGTEVSLNRFMERLLRWAVETHKYGLPVFDEEKGDFLEIQKAPGVIWFGEGPEPMVSEDDNGVAHEVGKWCSVSLILDFRDQAIMPPSRKPQSAVQEQGHSAQATERGEGSA